MLVKILKKLQSKLEGYQKETSKQVDDINKKLADLKEISISTEPATVGYKDKYDLLSEALKDIRLKQFNNTKAELLAKFWFNVEMPNQYYQLRYTDNSIMFFSIRNVNLITNNTRDKPELTDMIITLTDESLNSSLMLTLSIKDFKELLKPKTYKYNSEKTS